jgi:hypothetical protein
VREQIADRDRPLRRNGAHGRSRHGAGGRRQRHGRLLERRDVARDRVAEAEPALLDQHHRRHAGERLRLRGDAEDRVFGHGARGLEVGPAVRLELDDTAVARHERDEAGDAALVDVALHPCAQALEALRRKPDRLGPGGGGRLGAQQRRERQEQSER